MKPIPKINPRKIDQSAILDAIKNETIRKIEQETRRRRGRVDTVPMEHVKRPLGECDISDIPQDTPWQKQILDKYAQIHPLGAPYVCPRCGQQHLRGIPPPNCRRCGFETPIGKLLREKRLRR